jgi:hypothetical protein
MHGAVYGTLLLAVIAIAAIVVNPYLAVLGIFVLVGLLVFAVAGKAAQGTKVGAGPGPSVPTTADASYDPVGGASRVTNQH